MLVTNLTTNHYHLPGFELLPDVGEVLLLDAHYLSDDALREAINNLYANSKISVANVPVGFPVPTGDDLDADIREPSGGTHEAGYYSGGAVAPGNLEAEDVSRLLVSGSYVLAAGEAIRLQVSADQDVTSMILKNATVARIGPA